MDLHQKEIQGFFNIPVDNLRASPFLLQYIQEEVTTLGYEHNLTCTVGSSHFYFYSHCIFLVSVRLYVVAHIVYNEVDVDINCIYCYVFSLYI